IPDLLFNSDSGRSSADNITNSTTVSISVSGNTGDRIRLFRDGIDVGIADVAAGAAAFSVGPLTDGVYRFTALAEATAGNVSVFSAPLQVTVDTQAPQQLTL